MRVVANAVVLRFVIWIGSRINYKKRKHYCYAYQNFSLSEVSQLLGLGTLRRAFTRTTLVTVINNKKLFSLKTSNSGTTMIDFPDGLVVISVPYKNGTASIDVTEYQKRMLNTEKTVNDTANLMGTNIQGNSFKFVEDDSMDFCILFNSENRR